VSREHQATAIGALRAGDQEQVGLLSVGGWIPADPDAGSIDIVADEVGQREVTEVAGRIDPDQAREEGAVGERVSRGGQVPGSLALTTTCRESRVFLAEETRLMPPPPSSLRVR
jgi:hypothetical protein